VRAVCIIPNCGKSAPAGEAFCAIHRGPWSVCPSGHCERRGECASPNDCIATERARDRIAAALDDRLKQHALDREALDCRELAEIALTALRADGERAARPEAELSGAIKPDATLYPQFSGQRRADVQYIDAALSLYRGPSYRELAAAWLRILGALREPGGAANYRSDPDDPGEIRCGSNVVISR